MWYSESRCVYSTVTIEIDFVRLLYLFVFLCNAKLSPIHFTRASFELFSFLFYFQTSLSENKTPSICCVIERIGVLGAEHFCEKFL